MSDYEDLDDLDWEEEYPGIADDDITPERFYQALHNALVQLRSAATAASL